MTDPRTTHLADEAAAVCAELADLSRRMLSILGDLRAARRGPAALGRRKVRQAGHRWLSKLLRKSRWTRP